MFDRNIPLYFPKLRVQTLTYGTADFVEIVNF